MVSMSEKMASSVDFSAFSKAKDLQKRLLFTLFALIVFRLGTYVTIPGVNPTVLHDFFSDKTGGLIGMFNSFTGGRAVAYVHLCVEHYPLYYRVYLNSDGEFYFSAVGGFTERRPVGYA